MIGGGFYNPVFLFVLTASLCLCFPSSSSHCIKRLKVGVELRWLTQRAVISNEH